VAQLVVTERGAEACALSKPTITERGGLPLNRAIASSMAAALALFGLVLATSRAQHCGQAKLYTPQSGLADAE
jgi:hypothetical protein